MPTGFWLYSYAAIWALIALESLLMIALIRQVAALYAYHVKNDPDVGLSLGTPAPFIQGTDVYGKPFSLEQQRGKKTLVYFVSLRCSSCRLVMERVFAVSELEGLDIVLVFNSAKTAVQLYMAERWRGTQEFPFYVLADDRSKHMDHYKVAAVPYLVVVDEDGHIGAKGMPATLAETGMLIRQTTILRDRRRTEEKEIVLPPLTGVEPVTASSHTTG